jgi:rRNA maturation protein Nop10
MAGKLCPNCAKQTFFETPSGRACTKCKYEMTLKPLGGTGGRGKKCANCGDFKIYDNKCTGCGATFKIPKPVD